MLAYNILQHLVPIIVQIAFATKPIHPLASITVALSEIHWASSHLEIFVLFSLPLKLFIQAFTELTLLPSVSHQLKYCPWKSLVCSLIKIIHSLPWFILLIATTATSNYVIMCLFSASPTRVQVLKVRNLADMFTVGSIIGSKWSTKYVTLNSMSHILISWKYTLLVKLWISKSTFLVILKSEQNEEDGKIRPT